MIATRLRARALGAGLAARLGPAPCLAGPPRSVFSRAINFEAADGGLVTLHGPGPLAAPFAIALSPWGDDLADADVALDLDGARRVDLTIRPARHGQVARARLGAALAEARPARDPAAGLSSPRADGARAALARAIRRRDADDFLDAARALVGLGEGLTPAGDDYLVGTLAVLHRLASGWPASGVTGPALDAYAGHATTVVGATFLRHAIAGQFSEPLRDLAMAQSPAVARAAVASLARMGATSGADTLAGMREALDALGGVRG
ncbi:MAG TPA: DUF2877 domain-containing protein [Methylomirabilota bacterium]|nr:DUF2877 domain-containing protein [Methylomirabilota bacterium]